MGICGCVMPRPGGCEACKGFPNSLPIYQEHGWQCPKCFGIMSPNYPTCFYCKPEPIKPMASDDLPSQMPAEWREGKIKHPQIDNGFCLHNWEYKGDAMMINYRKCKTCGYYEQIKPTV